MNGYCSHQMLSDHCPICAAYLPIGSRVSVHHMREDYYQKWERLRRAEQSAKRMFERTGKWEHQQVWARVQLKLEEHESRHNTD